MDLGIYFKMIHSQHLFLFVKKSLKKLVQISGISEAAETCAFVRYVGVLHVFNHLNNFEKLC